MPIDAPFARVETKVKPPSESRLTDVVRHTPLRLPPALLAKLFRLDAIENLRDGAYATRHQFENWFEAALAHLQLTPGVESGDLAKVPKSGPVIVVANHPFGIGEGILLGALLRRVRPDVKIMANRILAMVPEMQEHLLGVDSFGGDAAASSNVRPLMQAREYLQAGGLLILFPAGEVSAIGWDRFEVKDREWSESFYALAKWAKATVVPIHVEGRNSALFQTAGLVHPVLRTALLAREFVQLRQRTVNMRIGAPIPAARLTTMKRKVAVDYVRERVYALRSAAKPAARLPQLPKQLLPSPHKVEPVAPATPQQQILAEIQALGPTRVLVEQNGWRVVLVNGAEAPATLSELGRLREISFRGVGEGSGKARDLDRFDLYYDHLVLCHGDDCQIAGGYRLARTQQVLASEGPRGLYTSTLFRFRPEFWQELGPAVELGRSFVHPDFQKSFQPLLLLWKAIGRYVMLQPGACRLFGPVSMPADYSDLAKELTISYLGNQSEDMALRQLVAPRKPFQGRSGRSVANLVTGVDDADTLSELLSDIDPQRRGLPVLLRQYLALGGTVLAFNVDPDFSDVLDALLMVDLRKTPVKQLQRYLGPDGVTVMSATQDGTLLGE